jgi:hypothetical protein
VVHVQVADLVEVVQVQVSLVDTVVAIAAVVAN